VEYAKRDNNIYLTTVHDRRTDDDYQNKYHDIPEDLNYTTNSDGD